MRRCSFLVNKTTRSPAPFHAGHRWTATPVTVDHGVRRYSNNSEPFLNGTSANYVEDMYNTWKTNPKNVHASWDSFFRNSTAGAPPGKAYQAPPSLGRLRKNEVPLSSLTSKQEVAMPSTEPAEQPVTVKDIHDHLSVMTLVRTFHTRGHLVADLDPLGINYASFHGGQEQYKNPYQVISAYHLSQADLKRVFHLPPTTFIGGKEKALPLGEIFSRLKAIYCNHIGVEYMFIKSTKKLRWLRHHLESPGAMDTTKEQQQRTLERLTRAAGFESFLARKWSSEKRFGLEGCEILIPALKQVIDTSAELGVESFVLGMPHRGRLNVLANVCRKPLDQIFTQFAGLEPAGEGSGDVKYHLGTSVEMLNRVTNKQIKVTLMANPSHLEAVDPVVQGKVRAQQFYSGDTDGAKTMPILMHGDAAFAGQGVVYECFHLSALPDYTTHGTVHVVVNNQIGFTTDPRRSRSSPYCTDVGRVVGAPIFHVNSDDPDAVMRVCKVAAQWRAHFHKDVIIDLVCYRRYGHNEVDEPMFTQPLMYQKIKKTEPVAKKYSRKLIEEKVVTPEWVKEKEDKYFTICEESFVKASKQTHFDMTDWLDSPWPGFYKGVDLTKVSPTGVKEETLKHIGLMMSTPPPTETNFVLHKGIERILHGRMENVNNRMVDWALGEAMAFGSLLKEGVHVRLSGQDVERGTFSHRHHVYHHQTVDKETYRPLCNLYPDQAPYTVCNSSLSEYAVLGFEMGYSLNNPHSLVLWEAQFGDFNNTAQAIIDSMLASGESKWMRQCGMVLLQPHGMEGMGPEHSSARLERFLQLSVDIPKNQPPADDKYVVRQLLDANWFVVNCSTPANYFHVLRRQIALPFRKPLILITPKSLLRLPEARSSFDLMKENTEFIRLIPEDGAASKNPGAVKKLLLCSGKVYYELVASRSSSGQDDKIAISRVEQIMPFPYDLVKKECDRYPNATLWWCQEEHRNQGAWTFVYPRIDATIGGGRRVDYVGRAASAAPATGNKKQYTRERERFLKRAMTI